jgi:hypothetical protein
MSKCKRETAELEAVKNAGMDEQTARYNKRKLNAALKAERKASDDEKVKKQQALV